MAVLPNGPGPLTAAFLIREANGMYRSREEVNVEGGADGLDPGTLLAAPAGTGLPYTRVTAAGTPAAILWQGIPARPEGEATNILRRTIVVRDCEVHKTELIYGAGSTGPQIAAADTALRALGIIPRL